MGSWRKFADSWWWVVLWFQSDCGQMDALEVVLGAEVCELLVVPEGETDLKSLSPLLLGDRKESS